MRFSTGLLLSLPLVLIARDNPFVPAITQSNHQTTSTVSTKVSEPKKVEVSTPVKQVEKKHTQIASVTSPKILKTLNYQNVRLVFREGSVYVETKDRLLKQFSLKSPPSIVLDFKSKADFASKRDVISIGGFKKVEIGAHGNSYRVVFRLDQGVKYSVDKKRYGYVVTLK